MLRRAAGGGDARWSMARPFAASFYRNGAAPHFVNRALAELVAVGMATESGSDRLRPAWEEALHLRRLLEFEFVFGSKWQFAADLREELALFVPDWLHHTDDPGAIWAGLSASGLYVAPRLLRSSFEAYAIVSGELVALGDTPVPEHEAFVARCLAVGREASLRHLIVSDEAAAADPLRTAIRLADHRGLLDGPRPGLGAARVVFAAEIAALTGRLEQLAELARHPAVPVAEPEGTRWTPTC